jgi:hypothetical protein
MHEISYHEVALKKLEAEAAAEAQHKKDIYKAMFNSTGGDAEPDYAYKLVEHIVDPASGQVKGHKVLYSEVSTWDADFYNYGSAGMQGIKDPCWRSKNGVVKKLVDIELSHLKNIIALVMRKDANYSKRLIFKQLLQEQKRREDTGELW